MSLQNSKVLRQATVKQALARDIGADPLQIWPPAKGVVTSNALTSGATAALALQTTTTLVRFFVPTAAGLNGVYIRWNPSGTTGDLAGAATAHNFIPTGIPIDLPKPWNANGVAADTHLLMRPDGANATMFIVEV